VTERPDSLRIVVADPRSETAQTLLGALDAELAGRYPEENVADYQIDPDEVTAGRGLFLVAWWGAEAVGCCALRRLDDDAGEVKRMYVRPAQRGCGVARALLQAIEVEARGFGVRQLLLETGVRQPEAVGLYQRFGYARIPPFGAYSETPLSLCMAKTLAP
jgi:putative acetyltransferase